MNANNKYKTVICKHFEQSGHCYLGAKCHFAHGKEELRNPSDPLPPNKGPGFNDNKQFQGQGYPGSSVPPSVSNYKTIQCKFFEKGHCKFGNECSFAHGDQDIRASNTPAPSHILQMNNSFMSPFYDQATQNQIAQQQIMFLIGQLQQYHANDQEHQAKLQQATELNNSGNVQAAASTVYSIINRKNRTKEEEASYNSLTQQVQSFGGYLFQNLQMAYSQQAMYGFNQQAMMGNPMMGMSPNYGGNPDMNQPKQYGGSNYKQNQQGRAPNQNNQDQSTDNTGGAGQNADSQNMSGLNNMMGNMQISNQPQGGKPKNTAYNNPNQSE